MSVATFTARPSNELDHAPAKLPGTYKGTWRPAEKYVIGTFRWL
jgi:hypothetical protein